MRPFSRSRLRTSWISNRPPLASFTPMARFSKSMKTAMRGSSDMGTVYGSRFSRRFCAVDQNAIRPPRPGAMPVTAATQLLPGDIGGLSRRLQRRRGLLRAPEVVAGQHEIFHAPDDGDDGAHQRGAVGQLTGT